MKFLGKNSRPPRSVATAFCAQAEQANSITTETRTNHLMGPPLSLMAFNEIGRKLVAAHAIRSKNVSGRGERILIYLCPIGKCSLLCGGNFSYRNCNQVQKANPM